MRAYFNKIRLRFGLILLAIVAAIEVFLLTLPLTRYFSYEYAAANAVLLYIAFGLYLTAFLKKRNIEKLGVGFREIIYTGLIFLLLPAVLGIGNSLLFVDCPFCDGILFYLIITVPAMVVACAAALFSFYLSNKYAYVIFLLSVLFFTVVSVLDIYLFPQVFVYNPVIGYLPGVIYDEVISIDETLLLYRLIILLTSALFIGVISARLKANKGAKWKPVLLFLLMFISSYIVYPFFGFINPYYTLREGLPVHYESEHFLFYFPANTTIEEKGYFELLHEYYYRELSDFFETSPDEKTEVFVFRDADQKEALYGARSVDMARLWDNAVFLTIDSYYGTIKHELAHIFSAGFGEGPFAGPDMLNPAMLEGLAVAASPFYGEYPVRYLSAAARKFGTYVPLERLFSGLHFFGSVSSVSYVQSGAFIEFLIERYGIEKMKLLYCDIDFQKYYGQDINALEGEFTAYLDSIPVNDRDSVLVNHYFEGSPLIEKSCPRYTASIKKEAYKYLGEGDYDEAFRLFDEAKEYSDDYGVRYGKILCYEGKEEFDSALAEAELLLEMYENSPYQASLMITYADLLVLNSDFERGEEVYRRVEKMQPGRYYRYIAAARCVLLENERLDKHYLTGSTIDRYSILKEINKDTLYFKTVPALISHSENLGESYPIFIENIPREFIDTSYYGVYAALKTAEYSLRHLDLKRAAEYSQFAVRYSKESTLKEISVMFSEMVTSVKNNLIKLTYCSVIANLFIERRRNEKVWQSG